MRVHLAERLLPDAVMFWNGTSGAKQVGKQGASENEELSTLKNKSTWKLVQIQIRSIRQRADTDA